MTILKQLRKEAYSKETALQFHHGWRLTAQSWLDDGMSRDDIALHLVRHVGPRMARSIMGQIK